jgi:hypothetical protein
LGGGPSDEEKSTIKQECLNKNQDTTSFTLDVFNLLNTSGAENYDVTAVLTSDAGSVVTFTDTTSPTAQNLNCGETYTLRVLSTDGASGDNSVVKGIRNCAGSCPYDVVDGDVVFVAQGASMNLKVDMEQQATLKVKMKDGLTDAWVYDSGDSSATDYETDTVTFESSTDNTTAMAIGAGEAFDWKFFLRAVQTDTNWNDRGVIVLVDAGATVYDENQMTGYFNGKEYSNAKESLTKKEQAKFSDYEYAFIIPKEEADITGSKDVVFELSGAAISNVDPGSSDDVQVDIISRGTYAMTSNSDVLAEGAVKDDSSLTVVRSIMDITVDVG